MPFIFKASYDKANRTSAASFRGPGLDEGLRVLGRDQATRSACRSSPTSTSRRRPRAAAEVADVLQIPAFLSRQTDLLVAAARTGRVVNIKKGQFLAPDDMKHAVAKVTDAGQPARARHRARHELRLPQPRRRHARVPDDARAGRIRSSSTSRTACSCPAAATASPPAWREYIEPLASAGVAAGVDGVFLEVHEEPSRAKSDAQNALRLDLLEPLLRRLMRDRRDRRKRGAAGSRRSAQPTWLTSRSRARCSQTEAAAILALVDRARRAVRARGRAAAAHAAAA